ncbi:hypothetical protein BJY00DRAFT_321902 [Aspergillus carlsbadensis]|nr:hypothetical protein BJY00DRAFT_321902 [Aspergillus carlsbadensis]
MKSFIILGALCVSTFQGLVLASPTPSPEDGYELFTPSWDVQVTPGGELVTLNGTIEEVHAELLRLNPNWDEDFPEAEEAEDADELTERDFDFDSDLTLEKRTDFTGSKYNCFGSWGLAKSIAINQGITYLRKVNGNPRAAAGPGRCARVSCSYNSGIHWCNDSRSPKTLNSFGSIADGAKYIVAKCKRGSGVSAYTAGQVFHKTNWNVIVREDKC